MRISVIGDSISTFEGLIPEGWNVFYGGENLAATGVMTPEDTWWMQVVRGLGGEFWANASWSGSCVEGVGYPAGESRTRTDALKKDGISPDMVLVFMGVNDFGWGGTQNQEQGRGTATPYNIDLTKTPVEAPGAAPQDAAKKFGEAYSRMLANITTDNPGVSVICITIPVGRMKGHEHTTFTYPFRGIHFDAYNQAIKTAAAQWPGCTVADARSLMLDYEALDGTHPTKRGMRQFAEMILASLGKGQPPTDCPPSQQVCYKPTCIGCPFAESTGFGWNNVCELLFDSHVYTNERGAAIWQAELERGEG